MRRAGLFRLETHRPDKAVIFCAVGSIIYHEVPGGNPLLRLLLGVLIVAFAIVLGIVIIYRAFHAVHTGSVKHPIWLVTSSSITI